jgi:hypothetical protein
VGSSTGASATTTTGAESYPTQSGREMLSNDNATHTRRDKDAKRSTGTGAAGGWLGAPDHDA